MLMVYVQDLLRELTLKQHFLNIYSLNQKTHNAFSSFWSRNYKSINIFHSTSFEYSDTWM